MLGILNVFYISFEETSTHIKTYLNYLLVTGNALSITPYFFHSPSRPLNITLIVHL